MLKASGVGAVYTEPKAWTWERQLCAKPLWRHPSVAKQDDAPERTRACRSRCWRQRTKEGGGTRTGVCAAAHA